MAHKSDPVVHHKGPRVSQSSSKIHNYIVKSGVSALQKAAYHRVMQFLSYDDAQLNGLLMQNSSVYAIADKISIIRYHVLNPQDSRQICESLQVMYPEVAQIKQVLPQLAINGKYVKNIVYKVDKNTQLRKGQIIKIYTRISDTWQVSARILV